MLSIITVTYHSESVMNEFMASLDRIRSQIGERVELVLHDNSVRNIGLSKATNLLLQRASGDIVLFTNPDVIFHEGISDMIRFVRDNTNFGAVPLFIGYNVNRRFPTATRIIISYTRIGALLKRVGLSWVYDDYHSSNHNRTIEQPGGSFLMMSKKAINKLSDIASFYDERFPVFWNDVDLAVRAKKCGIMFVQIPSCKIRHSGGHSSKGVDVARLSMLFYSSAGMMGFLRKWKMHPNLVRFSIFLDSVLFLMVKLFSSLRRNKGDTFGAKGLRAETRMWILRLRSTFY